MSTSAVLASLGGIARTSELAARGCTPKAIATAVHSGSVERVRIGWFALPGVPEAVKRAHAVGGRPACATVASLHGLWMLTEPCLHVEVQRQQSRLRHLQGEVKLHWTDRAQGADRRGQPLAVALIEMATCVPTIAAVCAIDSALHRGMVRPEELWVAGSETARSVLAMCDSRAESGVESVFRVRASAAEYVFRTQAQIPGGRVDFLFGDRLIVEVDGAEFHSGYKEFVADRERDAWHAAIGYRVVRLTYDQVIRRWHEVESLLRLLHARSEHLDRTRIRRFR